ncbi:MAG: hypothetical protein ACRC10_03745 [Thermoguttaceae bacterium]
MTLLQPKRKLNITDTHEIVSAISGGVQDESVMVVGNDKPIAYLFSPQFYEQLMDQLEDMEDRNIVRTRGTTPSVAVSLDELFASIPHGFSQRVEQT